MDVTGNAALGNTGPGISVDITTTIGTISGNVISANGGDGIRLTGSGLVITSNKIGVGLDGTTDLGNGAHGVNADGTGNLDSLVGSNTIAHSTLDNVFIGAAATGVAIGGNAIDGDCRFPISFNGVIPANDALDVDTGANNLQNFPIVDPGATPLSTTVSGTLSSEASTLYTIDVYFSASAHSSGNGPGETLLGSTTAMTDPAGNTSWSLGIAAVGTSGVFTAVAVADVDGSTSCFSPAVPVDVSAVDDWSVFGR